MLLQTNTTVYKQNIRRFVAEIQAFMSVFTQQKNKK